MFLKVKILRRVQKTPSAENRENLLKYQIT